MANAEVGDEQRREDPTTIALEEKLADMLGFSAGMFFPSATLANEIAILTLTQPGDELIAWEDCHLFIAEAGGPAVLSGVMPRPILTPTGIFTGAQVENFVRWEKGPHFPPARLVSVENTTNMAGGYPWPKAALQEVVQASRKHGLSLHMDGARFFHASVALGMKPQEMTEGFDMVSICLSKGLGCPVGAVLVFDKKHVTKIRLLKQRLGGALRQSGILAAAGLYALENNIPRLAEDHANATTLAAGLSNFPFLSVENPKPATNMVFFNWASKKQTPETFSLQLEKKGVRFSEVGAGRFRAVTHLDIGQSDIPKTIQAIKDISSEF